VNAVAKLGSLRAALVAGLLASLFSSQRLANLPGEAGALSALQTWSVIAAAALFYAALFVVAFAIILRLSRRTSLILSCLALGSLILLFLLLYPHIGLPADASGFGDRDDALTLMGRAAASGSNPYGVVTYLGNPVSPLMGSVILGAPATFIAGSAGWMNPLILAGVGALALRRWDPRVVLLALVALATNAGFMEDYLLGGDAYTVPLLLATACFLLLNAREIPSRWGAVTVVVLGGLAGASRVTTLTVVVAIAIFCLVRRPVPDQRGPLLAMSALGLLLGVISAWMAGGLASWPFAGDVNATLRRAGFVLLLCVLIYLVRVWRRPSHESALTCFTSTAPLLAVSLAPILFQPSQMFRVWTYLVLGAPWAYEYLMVTWSSRFKASAYRIGD
jgi:hypothetical protein